MSRCMYDYAVEMMGSYHEEEPKEFLPTIVGLQVSL